MRLEEFEILPDRRENLIVLQFLLCILGHVENVRFLVSKNFGLSRHHSYLSPVCWRLGVLSYCGDKILIFSILINFVLYLTHNVVDFGAELIQQIIRLQTIIFLCPCKLSKIY